MTRPLLCTLCPNCCALEVVSDGTQVIACTGNRCPKGAEYAALELFRPMRNITTTVAVRGGVRPLCPVRLSAPIPRHAVREAIAAIHRCAVLAPVTAGQVILPDLLGLGVQVVATASVRRSAGPLAIAPL